jgi:hypothetical protein
MPTKLATTVKKIDEIPNKKNVELIRKFHEFMISNQSSERHQNNNLKAIISFSRHLESSVRFQHIDTNREILFFLNSKIKSKEEDPEQKWITTWNDYVHRIKHFLRWVHNCCSQDSSLSMEDWKTPSFLQIIDRRSKSLPRDRIMGKGPS